MYKKKFKTCIMDFKYPANIYKQKSDLFKKILKVHK